MLPTYNVYLRVKDGYFQPAGYRAFVAGTRNDKAMAANQHWRKVATYENVSAKKAIDLAKETDAGALFLTEVIN